MFGRNRMHSSSIGTVNQYIWKPTCQPCTASTPPIRVSRQLSRDMAALYQPIIRDRLFSSMYTSEIIAMPAVLEIPAAIAIRILHVSST